MADQADVIIAGLGNCTGDYAVYATTYVPKGADYLKMASSNIAGECGVDVATSSPSVSPSAGPTDVPSTSPSEWSAAPPPYRLPD